MEGRLHRERPHPEDMAVDLSEAGSSEDGAGGSADSYGPTTPGHGGGTKNPKSHDQTKRQGDQVEGHTRDGALQEGRSHTMATASSVRGGEGLLPGRCGAHQDEGAERPYLEG